MVHEPTRESLRIDKLDRATLQRRLIGAAIALVGAIALGGFNAFYINHVEAESTREIRKETEQTRKEAQHELCSFIIALDDALANRQPGSPALQPTGERLVAATRELRQRYRCDNP
jgi:hypothetical protein